MTEAQLQRAVAGYLSWALTAPWTAMPAGGGGEMRGKILRGMGLRPGWPDLQLVGPGGVYYGIELKAEKGVLSKAQVECHSTIIAAGGHVAVCRSLEDVQAALRIWGIPLRAVSLTTERMRAAFADAFTGE